MKRLIKFRIWDKLRKLYFYPDKGYQGHFRLTLNGEFLNLQNGSGFDDYEVQQYIGFRDRYNKDVYEGDIVRFLWEKDEHDIEETIGEVCFKDGIFYFDRELSFATNDSNFKEDSIEVLGNILENPELLK